MKSLCFWIAATVVMSVLSASATEPQKPFRGTAIRSEDEMLAASGIPTDKRDKAARERVLASWTKELKVKSIDFQKQMILNLQFDFSPTPRTFPEIVKVATSEDKKKLTVHWRWVSPGRDDTQVGGGRSLSILVPPSDATIELQSETGDEGVREKI